MEDVAEHLEPGPPTCPLTEADIVGAVADLLAGHGYRFIVDSRLPAMRQALQPFLETA